MPLCTWVEGWVVTTSSAAAPAFSEMLLEVTPVRLAPLKVRV